MLLLRPAQQVRADAEAVLRAQRRRLRSHGVPGRLLLVGASSVDGALTRGDVDLHLRVAPAVFPEVRDRLRDLLVVVHPGIWSPTLATFAVPAAALPRGSVLPTGLALTPEGSEHDLRFTRCWQLLRADADLLAEHNAVKLASTEDDYEQRKPDFFDHLLHLWPGHPAGGAGAPAPPPDRRGGATP
ncbi:hypothetical protein [Kineococcus indalonis]|uniref:hypothetical protein n=1 Tax=Kineococcus indalonis TaxID=2696566 RepID=UPI0014122717|nr:hypothetical protein [Kineococcus indalonis]NAZ86918.1 hypothetical protein [Kineococcus indalonis]